MIIQIMPYVVSGVVLLLLLAKFSDWLPRLAECMTCWEANRVGDEETGKRYADKWVVEPNVIPAELSYIVVAIGYAVNRVRIRVAARETRRQRLLDGYPRESLGSIRYSDLIRVCHGDRDYRGGGGHLYGTGGPGRTEFPPNWDMDRVAAALQAVAHEPDEVRQDTTGRWRAIGLHEEVKVVVGVNVDGRIVYGWPLCGPRVQRNPARSRKRRGNWAPLRM